MTTHHASAPPVPPPTERRSIRSMEIDRMSSEALLRLINAEDATVPAAVRAVLPHLAEVVDRAVTAIERGGRIHYFGAGTSGRFGVLDAAEVPPTYGVAEDLVVAHLAGGARAMSSAVEDAEDIEEAGAAEARQSVRRGDIVFGLAASGRTPYVAAALAEAQRIGAHTVAITSNPDASVAANAEVHLCVATGQEVVTGSTRMKAGTAQKLVLHSFSTALMVRLGRTYSNLMIDVVPTNDKLRRRVVRLLQDASGSSESAAADALLACGGDTKAALVMLLSGSSATQARAHLVEGNGDVRAAVAQARIEDRPRPAGTSWLGVDIGASGFRIAIVGEGPTIEAQGQARPIVTADRVDLDAVIDELAGTLRRLRTDGIGSDIDAVMIGLAGSAFFSGGSAHLAARVLSATGGRSVSVASDILPSYVGAIGLAPGAVLAAGTGAIALGTDLESIFRRVDGLGHLLGDHGSGAWIGRRALEVALAGEAGRPVVSPALESAMRARFGGAREAVSAVYGTAERSAILASFVPDVVGAAEAGDPVASAILDDAASALVTTLRSAGKGIDGPLSVVGGLVQEGTAIHTRIAACVDLQRPVGSAAYGATVLARQARSATLSPLITSQIDTYTEGD